MNISKDKIRMGIWIEDEDGNVISNDDSFIPNSYCHVVFPLEINEHIYKTDSEGHYGGKDRVCTCATHLCRSSGRLAVAMVNSGEYELDEALAILASACERCVNVLYNKYLPELDGYPEYSEEWKKCNTVCDFCRDEENRTANK